jgi:DNA-binding GntR family transcriptional regulator
MIQSLPSAASDSRRQQVLQSLRDAIVSGRLRPGDRLVEADVSRQTGVSRGPVREALRQLEQEGLVVSHPYRATEVIGVSQEEVAEVLVPIRLTIERFAFRHALPMLTSEDFQHLAELVTTMKLAVQAGDPDRLADADMRFHERVIVRSQRLHCLQVWRTIEPRVRAYFRRDVPAHVTPLEVVAEHEQLLDVLRTRDERTVVTVLETHIRNFMRFDSSECIDSEVGARFDDDRMAADNRGRLGDA